MSENCTELATTAMCVWEYVMECEVNKGGLGYPNMKERREAVGTIQFRRECAELGFLIERAYHSIGEKHFDGIAFDWELVPDVVGWCFNAEEYPTFGTVLSALNLVKEIYAKTPVVMPLSRLLQTNPVILTNTESESG